MFTLVAWALAEIFERRYDRRRARMIAEGSYIPCVGGPLDGEIVPNTTHEIKTRCEPPRCDESGRLVVAAYLREGERIVFHGWVLAEPLPSSE